MNHMGTILIVTPFFPPKIGGIQNHVFNLVKRIKKDNRIIVLTTSDYYKQATIKPNIIVIGKRAKLAPMNNPIAFAMMYDGIKARPSLVHVHGIYQMTCIIGLFIAKLTRCPCVVSMHGRPYYSSRIHSLIQRIYETTILRFILKRYNQVIALTSYEKSFLVSIGIDEEKISIIPNGVDTTYWIHSRDKTKKEEYGKYLLFVGSLIKRKNPLVLMEPFKILKERKLVDKLVIVGKGPLKNELMDLSRSMKIENSVVFLDELSRGNLRDLYGQSKVVIHPSLMEGLPTIVLEAMSTKSIIISSNIPAVHNLIEKRKNGFLFENEEKDSLLEALLEALSLNHEEEETIRECARAVMIQNYDWSVIVRNIELVYQMAFSCK